MIIEVFISTLTRSLQKLDTLYIKIEVFIRTLIKASWTKVDKKSNYVKNLIFNLNIQNIYEKVINGMNSWSIHLHLSYETFSFLYIYIMS